MDNQIKISVTVQAEDQVLTFTEKDLVDFEFSTPFDKEDITPAGKVAKLYKLTTPHFKMDAVFPVGKGPRWEDAK